MAQALHGEEIAGRPVVGLVLPVVFGLAGERLATALRDYDPEIVICLGLAANRTAISLERVAINVDDARIADNGGQQPIDQPIVADGPAAYWSTLPIKAMRSRLEAAGFAAEISQSAGTYVCNHVFYGLMHALTQRSAVRGGFVHIPRATGNFDASRLKAAIHLAAATALTEQEDYREGGGAIS